MKQSDIELNASLNGGTAIGGAWKQAGNKAVMTGGLTKREKFASDTLCAIIASGNVRVGSTPREVAQEAIAIADILLEELVAK